MMGVPKHPSNSCPSVIPLHLAHCIGPDTEKALTADQKLNHGDMVSPTLIDKLQSPLGLLTLQPS